MKVKVTPRDGAGNPIPGAGSFEIESSMMPDGSCFGAEGAHFPASWCEAIPEITPEPGDIVEDYQGTIFVFDPSRSATPFKVSKILARKPMDGLAAHDAMGDFYRTLSDADTATLEVQAYNNFLAAILGTPYARVGR